MSNVQVSLIFRWLEVVRSLPPPEDFELSENQTTKKWKWVFTPPPRETEAGEYEVIISALPRPCPGWAERGVSNDWCQESMSYKENVTWVLYLFLAQAAIFISSGGRVPCKFCLPVHSEWLWEFALWAWNWNKESFVWGSHVGRTWHVIQHGHPIQKSL